MFLNWIIEKENGEFPFSTRKRLKHGRAHADWGIFRLVVCYDGHTYDDGTRLYGIYLCIPSAFDDDTWIKLKKKRGYMIDAMKMAEILLFAAPYNYPKDIAPLKAVDIQWDTDGDEYGEEDTLGLPTEIIIPPGVLVRYTETKDGEIISDYLSDRTGFCHKGFRLVKMTEDGRMEDYEDD